MGKPTGFLEYNRETNQAIEPKKRIKNFDEFHPPMQLSERQLQGARCMNCGVPFCQSAMMLNNMISGCPLHNLIPEWNDEVYNGNWAHAVSRLRKTNNFPEFTGRVCPALCEAACTCGLYDSPVTVRENELAIIETGYEQGYIKAKVPAFRTGKKVAIIGSGPSGLACADQLNQRGHSVTVYEKEDRPGGLLMYGIPNMKLEKHVIERRIKIMEEEGIEFFLNTDITEGKTADKVLKNYDAVVLCCGAKNARDLNVEGRESNGIYFAVDFLRSTTKSLLDSNLEDGKFISAKGKNVIIIGGGDTGNDCVGTCIRHGAKSVTQLEMMPKPPEKRSEDNQWPQWPKVFKTDYGQEEATFVYGHDPRIFETTVKKIISDEKGCVKAVKTVNLSTEKETVMDAELVLIAAGFLGPDKKIAKVFDIEVNKMSNINTEAGGFRTNKDKIFACGDARRGQSLVVWAIYEGRQSAKEIDTYLMGYTNMI